MIRILTLPFRLVLALIKVPLKLLIVLPKLVIKAVLLPFKTLRVVGLAGLLAAGIGLGVGYFLGQRKSGAPAA